ncbi:hypothetical protein LDENG_00066770 [Lucifuga dentata]|nr:hypothetical protein LDENG_00066770 [Lucifuga dentata]
MNAAKAKELQSTSTLEQFMAKLCRHHQRQIVDAIGFLQTEVKAFASSSTSQASTCRIQGITPTSGLVGPEKSCTEQRFSSASTHQSRSEDLSRDISTTPKTAFSRKTSSCAGSPLDLHRSESESIQGLVTSIPNFVDTENNRHGDHAPLKMKIMKTNNIADGKKLCVITTSLSSHSGILEDRQGSSNSSNRMEAHTARLSPSVKRHNPAGHAHPVRQRETLRHAKDSPSKSFSVHVTIPSNSPRTARKTIRASSDHRTRDSICRVPADPDLGHCDIVYIDKPITECLREQQRNMLPRRNARKSTRGHMYVEEMWELKTVRTLAGRKERGNCPNPMPEVITLITPKQMLSKPDGVPPVDMPFAAGGREKMSQQTPTEESDERVAPGTGDMGEVASSEIDVIVETSQTDQCQTKGQSAPLSPLSHQTEEKETDINEEKVQDATTDSRTTTESEESVAQVPFEAGKDSTPESRENLPESTDQVAAEPAGEPSENCTVEKDESQLPSAEIHHSESTQDGSNTSVPSDVRNVEEEFKANEKEKNGNEQPQEVLPETQTNHGNLGSTETSNPEVPTAEEMVEQQEINTVNPADSLTSLDTKNCDNDDDDKFDVSSKTLESLLKELPPWRRKRGTVITLPERLKQTKAVIVGYVNGRPISASDRSLRRRSTNSTAPPNKTPVKSKNVPKNTSGDPSAVKQPQEAHTPVKPLPQEADSSPDTPSTSKSKCPSKIKELQKPVQKERDSLPALPDQPLDSSQSTDSKRYLRSAKQKPAATCTSSLTTNPVTSTRPTTARDLPSAEHSPSLPCSSCPPPMSSPRIRQACPPAASEPSQMTAVPEPEKTQATDTKFNKSKKADIESGLQAKKKLRSAKFAADICENEKQQVSSEVSNPLENPVLVENKMESQIKPLRGKRVLRKEVQANDFGLQKKPSVSFIGDRSVSVDDSSSSSSDKVVRMPLRSESSKAETSNHPAVSPPMDNKKLVLRSQRFAALLTSASTTAERQRDVASPTRINPERITKNQVRHSASSTLPHSSVIPAITARPEPLKHNAQKFFEALNHEQNKHLIANLNIKYDKMQKGWIQMDKEGQPATKYKNKADRQAAIWKSKRRTRKPRSSEHQKYSPVQMLFMKSFDLGSICRWFLESTETKSLVIVKKVNTRLPAETQLCFHSSSGISGTSQGVFPSLQAERLKKHLKKFAIASPVKSNPKSQKLIARALEQEANAVKGKERKEISSVAQTLTKASSSFAEAHVQIGESQKAPGTDTIAEKNGGVGPFEPKFCFKEGSKVHCSTKWVS